MAKTASLTIRLDAKLKAMLERLAKAEDRSISSYVERTLALHHKMPKLLLNDPQPHHREDGGPAVTLPIAEGWPVAGITADHAEKLGAQLIEAAKISRRMEPAE